MEKPSSSETDRKINRVLITGSRGVIGTILKRELSNSFDVLGVDRKVESLEGDEFTVDLNNLTKLEEAFAGLDQVDAIIHLAANPDPGASWEVILRDNIVATANVYAVAKQYGVKRLIFASSTHLLGSYEGYPDSTPDGKTIGIDAQPRPDSFYGVSKGFGEQLARYYLDNFGIESICIRIGSVTEDDKPLEDYSKLWLSHRDLAQVFQKALESDVRFGVYFATSANRGAIYDLEPTMKDLGYKPKDGI